MSFANFDDMRDICLEFCEEEELRNSKKNRYVSTSPASRKNTKNYKYLRSWNVEKSPVNRQLEMLE
jgi:hypothetical protein